jgi:hypothetical protein
MATIKDDGHRRPVTSDSAENQNIGDNSRGAPVRPATADRIAENAIRLDEIETLLHELSTEFEPAKAAADEIRPGAKLAPESRYERVELPSVSGFDLGNPVDYDPDPTKYDYRQASALTPEPLTPQSMARKLAPAGATTSPNPAAALPDQDIAGGYGPNAGGAKNSEDETEAETSRPARRRLRLRPARRVSGSHPEPRPGFPERGVEAAVWDPRPLRKAGQSGIIYGAGLTVLFLSGAMITFVYLEPARDILPDRLAAIFDNVSQEIEAEPGKLLSDTGVAQPDTAGFRVASAEPQIETVQTGNNQTVPRTDQANAAPTQASAAIPAPAMEKDPADRIGEIADQVDKSDDRVAQDSVVQAISKDPQKRALDSTNGETWIVRQRIDDADPATTGSIATPVTVDTTATAAVSQQTSAAQTETVKIEETGSASVAGLGITVPSANNVSAYAPPVPSVQNDVPFPDTATPAVKPAVEQPVVKKDSPASSPSKIDILLKRGNSLLQLGNIASARLIFNRIAVMGDERGAKGMGMTYDPEVYRNLPVAGMTPDQKMADFWYNKAMELAEHKRIPDAAPTDAMSVVKN